MPKRHLLPWIALLLLLTPSRSEETRYSTAASSREISPGLRKALEKLKLPGIHINLEEWSVDVESRVCLNNGLLELIACAKDTKEHESIIAIHAKPSHVHAALLLLGAKPGSPAIHEPIDAEMTRFRNIPAHGSPVNAYLVFNDAEGKSVERPISDFIKRADHDQSDAEPAEGAHEEGFPGHTFIFAGSILVGEGDGPRRYLCDTEGHVISISTFGDELLCLPGFHEHANGALMWQVNDKYLPALDSAVILRLRPLESTRPEAPEGSTKAGEK